MTCCETAPIFYNDISSGLRAFKVPKGCDVLNSLYEADAPGNQEKPTPFWLAVDLVHTHAINKTRKEIVNQLAARVAKILRSNLITAPVFKTKQQELLFRIWEDQIQASKPVLPLASTMHQDKNLECLSKFFDGKKTHCILYSTHDLATDWIMEIGFWLSKNTNFLVSILSETNLSNELIPQHQLTDRTKQNTQQIQEFFVKSCDAPIEEPIYKGVTEEPAKGAVPTTEVDKSRGTTQVHQKFVLGEPHPSSPGEAILFSALAERFPMEAILSNTPYNCNFNKKTYILDFLLPNKNLNIEIDGYLYHKSLKSFHSDRSRDIVLQIEGLKVFRFPHDEITNDLEKTLELISTIVKQ